MKRGSFLLAVTIGAALASGAPAQRADSAAIARGLATCPRCAPSWFVDQRPVRIYGNTFYVGTRGLSAMLITSPHGHVLIDGTLTETAPLIAAHVRELGFRMEDVKLIVNSHAHYDHAGGIAQLASLSGATVAASAASAAWLEHGKPGKDDPQFGLGRDYPAVPRVRVIHDGEVLRAGDVSITTHFTPGHTPGGTSWSWRSCENGRCLDVVYADSQSPVSADDFYYTRSRNYSTGIADFTRSFGVLDRLRCDILLTPHPDAADLWGRLASHDSGNADALIDASACRRYAADARAALAKRIARERAAP